MSPYNYLSKVLNRIANRAAMTAAYTTWTDDFCRRENRETWLDKGDYPFGRKVTIADLSAMSESDKWALGIARWDEDLWVVPLWMFNYIADGETLVAIDGERIVKGVDKVDLDTRAGSMAYGFEDINQ